MNLLFLYVFYAQCSVTQSIIYSSVPLIRLRSFGFEKGATFTINISTPNISNIIIFLIREQGSFLTPNIEVSLSSSCEENPPFISELNSSVLHATTSVSWSGTINSHHVYHPYAVNCNRNSTIYKVITNFRNPSSHLDYRDNNYSTVYLYISFFYTAISLIWILNACFHSKFWIPLHSGFSFVSSTKAVLCSLESKKWEDRRMGTISYSDIGSNLYSFFLILHYTSFLVIPILAMAGWCIFRKNITFKEISEIIFSNLAMVLGIYPLNYTKTLKEIIISVTLLSIGSIAFLRIVTDYIVVLSRLEEMITNDQLVSKKKITLITRFASSFLVFGLGYMVAYILSMSFNFWEIVGDLIMETGYAILTFIELFFFLIRKNYEGEQGEFIEKKNPDYEKNIYYLVEPNYQNIAVITDQNN